ncbi:hypothetical protein TL16_g08984 [Triparma laevis f. inornata]|uniref:Uncharacterized protein n=2 Tax=Triparma laevis TaxID=1534972 RepID=A0A9W7DXP6_9STRA|nr:hypothetical protein TrLO_g10918 [Triparma laevis f. longispina]GMH81600.1 hypothetical protein TL16_g08984 [Triparma laevis f. inornata]
MLARLSVLRRPLLNSTSTSTRLFNNITYSGGQAVVGQGGFYGSGGSRSATAPDARQRPEAVAHAADIKSLHTVITEIDTLESKLLSYPENEVSNEIIGLRSQMKKLVTRPDIMTILDKLEYDGEPVWGLNERERDVVKTLRAKVNEA